jgi:uncharacterized protein YvpB
MRNWLRVRGAFVALTVLALTIQPLQTAEAGTNWEDAAWSALTPSGGLTSNWTATSWSAGRIDLFARGQDNALWHQGWDGAHWSGWQTMGGGFTAAPAAISWGPGRIDVFGRGLDGGLYTDSWTGSSWTGWQGLGGGLTSAPVVASWGPNRLDVFARGRDHALWHRGWDGSSWSAWQSLGGSLTSAPGAVSWGPNRIDVFGRGLDGALWHIAWTGSAWSGWQTLGGALTGAPTAASWGAGRLDVFVRSTDSGLWHVAWDSSAGAWSAWESRGGFVNGDPQAFSWEPNRIDVLIRSHDDGTWHTSWNGASWAGWGSLGGAPGAVDLPDVPFFAQVYSLSCEEAAIEMALGHDSIAVSQLQELNDIGVDLRSAFITSDGVLHWGDPYTNFVGDPNGSEVALTGYGTFFPTISRIATAYGAGILEASEGISAQEVYSQVLGNHPVVVWVPFDWTFHAHGTWLAFDGRVVQYEGPVEHAVTIVGVNQSSVHVFNPWFGPQWIDKATFESAYATYNHMAVVVE